MHQGSAGGGDLNDRSTLTIIAFLDLIHSKAAQIWKALAAAAVAIVRVGVVVVGFGSGVAPATAAAAPAAELVLPAGLISFGKGRIDTGVEEAGKQGLGELDKAEKRIGMRFFYQYNN